MNAAIITVGDEILIGQVVNTNSSWLAEQLNLQGIRVKEIISVSDNTGHIVEALMKYEGSTDIVLITGGLGPTKDDITKTTLMEFFGSKPVLYPDVVKHIEDLFRTRGLKVTEVNKLQALLPDNCIVLRNPSGTAQGMWFERGGTVFVSLPGVPYEMMDIMRLSLIPKLKPLIKGPLVLHKTIMTQGVPESYLSDRLSEWESGLPADLKLAYLPKPGIVRLRLTATGENVNDLKNLLRTEVEKALQIISKDVYGYDDQPLEKVVGDLLSARKETLSTAESCTGGDIARLITSVPGSSEYYTGSVVAYSNDVKMGFLGVNKKNIEMYGAVSKEVVEEMATGALNLFKTDYSIATSGIAGPEGGSQDKPVGTTWIAVASASKMISAKFIFGEHRGRNIDKASNTSLNMLRKMILQIE